MPAPSAPPPAAAKPEVNVSTLVSKTTPVAAPKSSAMQKSIDSLNKAAGNKPAAAPKRPDGMMIGDHPNEPPKDKLEPAKPVAEEKPPETAKPTETEKPADKPPETEQKPPETTDKPKEPTTDKKQSVGKFIDSLKATVKNLEAEKAKLTERLTAMGDMDAIAQRMEKAEARNKELEQEIRYVNFQKSKEFTDQYQKPYEEAWAKAGAELSEITVTDAEGNTRQATVKDMLRIANMPLGEARKACNEMFGDFADDVMAHYREIRRLSDAQTKALEEAKKTGSQREQEQSVTSKRIASEVSQAWEQRIAEDAKSLDFLKSKEGDEEWNSRLARAEQFVKDAWAADASDPKLTTEQRAEIIRKHVGLRNRAIGFSMLKMENKRLASKLESLQKELDGIKNSGPTNGNGRPASAAPGTATNRMEAALNSLRSLAK